MVCNVGKVNPPQTVLFIASLWYLLSGAIYSYFAHNDFMLTPLIAVIALSGVVSGIMLTRKKVEKQFCIVSPIAPVIALKISVYSFLLILITFAAYYFIDGSYFSYDKVERAEIISRLFYVRFIIFTACALLGILVIRWNSCVRQVKSIIIISYTLILLYSVIELNRELFLVLGLTYYVYYIFNVGEISVKKLTLYSLFAVLFLLVFKFAAYWMFFDKLYDGGIVSLGELVNWSRWTDMALINEWDLKGIQAEDASYFLTSLVFPFSNHDTSSEVLFRDILGRSGTGELYGYSGPLWAYGYVGYVGVFGFYLALSVSLSFLRLGDNIYLDVLAISMMFIVFRFFRQEWVVPIKMLIWVYLYPSAILIMISKIRINR